MKITNNRNLEKNVQLMNEYQQYVVNRLNALSRDLNGILESKTYDEHLNIELETELNELIQDIKKAFPDKERIQNYPQVVISGKAEAISGTTRYLLAQVRKLMDNFNSTLVVDEITSPQNNIFNLTQSQNVTQNNLQVFENMISNINKFDIDIEVKKEILDLTKKFKEESEKENANSGKLKEIFNSIINKSKEAAAMLSYWATITGAINLLLG